MAHKLDLMSDVIGDVYECSMRPEGWPQVLARICEAMGGVCAEIQSYDAATVQIRHAFGHGWRDDIWNLCLQHSRLNPGAPLLLVAPLGEPLWAERDYGYEAFKASLYYRLCFEGTGFRDYIHVPMVRDVTEMSGWGVTRHESRGAFGEDEVDFARLVTPHIRRSLRIGDLLAERHAAEPTLQGLLEALACAAVVVTRDGGILHRNAAADAELARGSLLQERKGRVASPITAVARLLAGMAEAGAARGRDLEVDDPPIGLRQITWVRLPGQGEDSGLYLLVLRTPAADLKTPLGTAAQLFGLTHAETQVLAVLLEGRSLDEAAELLGVSRSTVKTHLDAIFAKSGVRRQPDLVRRVMGLMTPVG